MNNGNSRLGVRGVEDLGGGLKAGFNFETGLSLKDGATATACWLLGPRRQPVAGWQLGYLQDGPHAEPVVLRRGHLGTDRCRQLLRGRQHLRLAGSGARNSSQFSYKTPNLGGFSAELGYIMKDDNGGNAKWDLNAIYANGPIAAALSVNKQKGSKTNYALGGRYNFGSFAAAASYNDVNVAGLKRRGFSLGGTANLGAFAVTLDLTRDTKNEIAGKKYTNGVLEGKYALSKRTFIYAAYLRLDSTNNYGIGVRHNF
jgi:predicted porin